VLGPQKGTVTIAGAEPYCQCENLGGSSRNTTLIRKDGCDYCTSCGYVGVCG